MPHAVAAARRARPTPPTSARQEPATTPRFASRRWGTSLPASCLLSLIDKRISPSFVCLLSLIDKRTFAIRVSVYIPGRYVYLVFAIPTCDTGSSIQTLTCVFTGHLLLFSFLLFSLLLFSLLLFFLLLFSLLLFSLLLFSPVVRRGPTSLPPTRAQVQLPRCG